MTKEGKISVTAVLPIMLIFTMIMVLGCDLLLGGLDTKALEAAIREAKTLQQSTVTAINGDNTPTNAFWATSADKAAFQSAITAAEAVLASAITQEEIDGATSTLRAAINVFRNEHRKPGTMQGNDPGDDPGDDPRNKIGEITGTITLTNIPATNRPKVAIRAGIDGAGVSYYSDLSEISLSGVPSNQTQATVNWSIPVYENEWIPEYASFYLSVTPAGTTSSLYIEIYPDDNWAIEIPEDLVVGDLGTYSIATVVLSGTINVNLDGNRVPRVQISVFEHMGDDWYGEIELTSPVANAPWTIVLRPFPVPKMLDLVIKGMSSNSDMPIFREIYEIDTPIPPHINSNISGININLGTFSRGAIIGELSGTITLTDIKNPRQTVYINAGLIPSQINLSGVSGTQASLNWSIPIYENDNLPFMGRYTLEVLESGSSNSFTIDLGVYDFILDEPVNLGTVTLWHPDVPRNLIPLAENQWVNGDISYSYMDWYTISVTPGTYNLWWNDGYRGDDTKTADIFVHVFRGTPENLTLIYYDNDNWDNEDSAWYSPSSFTVNFTGTVYVRVDPYYSDGTYGIVYSTGDTRPE